MKKPKRKRDIPAYMIKGEFEFAEAFGIIDPDKQAELRSEGMPCYNRKGTYFYDPEEVKDWMKNNWKVQQPVSL